MSISARDARLMAGDKSLDPGEPDDKLRGGYPGAKTHPHRTLAGGDRVGSLEVVPSPGHGKVVEEPVAAMDAAIARASS